MACLFFAPKEPFVPDTPDTHQDAVKRAMLAFQESLRDAGLKSTKQRDLIAERFFQLDEHISADELLDQVRTQQSRIGYATVYRTLKLLVEQGFAVTKDFGDGFTRYDPILNNQDPHHDHLICTICKHVEEFNDDTLAQLLKARSESLGYTLKRKKLELYGECQRGPSCPNLAKA